MSMRMVLRSLMNSDATSEELSNELELTRNRVLSNLRKLRNNGLVVMAYKEGYYCPVYQITKLGVEQVKRGVWD